MEAKVLSRFHATLRWIGGLPISDIVPAFDEAAFRLIKYWARITMRSQSYISFSAIDMKLLLHKSNDIHWLEKIYKAYLII